MTLSDADRRFLDGRLHRTRVGLYVVPAVLAALVGLWVLLFIYWPLAINPMRAAIYYEGILIEKGTVTTYAITVTFLLNALLLVLCSLLGFTLLWARTERRYLRMLTSIQLTPGPERPAAPEPKLAAK